MCHGLFFHINHHAALPSFLWPRDRQNSPKSLPQTFSDGANKKKKPGPELVVHIVRVAKYHHKAIIIPQRAWWLGILRCKHEGMWSDAAAGGAHVLCWWSRLLPGGLTSACSDSTRGPTESPVPHGLTGLSSINAQQFIIDILPGKDAANSPDIFRLAGDHSRSSWLGI